jgi:hypothetical protein
MKAKMSAYTGDFAAAISDSLSFSVAATHLTDKIRPVRSPEIDALKAVCKHINPLSIPFPH